MNQTSSSHPHGRRIGIVCSSWHADIVHRARDAALTEFERSGVRSDRIDAAVGARGEAGGATGINGDQSNTTAPDAGALYLY